jgi:hypothetical protein
MTDVKRRSFRLPRSARDWQLYTSMPGVGEAASKLTAALRAALKVEGRTRASVESAVHAVMVAERRFGACDTEPLCILARVLDRKFGRGA